MTETTATYLIEIAFDNPDERDEVLSAVEELLFKMGQVGFISARSEVNDN